MNLPFYHQSRMDKRRWDAGAPGIRDGNGIPQYSCYNALHWNRFVQGARNKL